MTHAKPIRPRAAKEQPTEDLATYMRLSESILGWTRNAEADALAHLAYSLEGFWRGRANCEEPAACIALIPSTALAIPFRSRITMPSSWRLARDDGDPGALLYRAPCGRLNYLRAQSAQS